MKPTGSNVRQLQHAARGRLAAPEPERDAVLDVVDGPRGGSEVRAELLEHQPGIGGGRELRKVGVVRKHLTTNGSRQLLLSRHVGSLR